MTQVGEDQDRNGGSTNPDEPVEPARTAPSLQPAASAVGLAGVIETMLGGDLPIAVVCFDGSRAGPAEAPATLTVRSADALRRVLTAPGELGFGRAYVAGDLDVDGPNTSR